MRKLLLLFCLGILTLALTAPAMAASAIDFSGYVSFFHSTNRNFTRDSYRYLYGNLDRFRDVDSFFDHRLHLNVLIKPTEDITVNWAIRSLNHTRWGTVPVGAGSGTGSELFTYWLYAEIRQPWGTISVGRTAELMPTNALGLTTLGYTKVIGDFQYYYPFDPVGTPDGIVYNHDFGNGWGLAAFYAKDEHHQPLSAAIGNRAVKDEDSERFGIEPRYTWDTGGVTFAVQYQRDMTNPDATSNYGIVINPAFVQAWGPFSIHFETAVGFGKTRYLNQYTEKAAGLGFFLDAVYNYGAGEVTLLSWFADGTSTKDNKSHNMINMGDFAPFLVAFNAQTLGTGAFANSLPYPLVPNNGPNNARYNNWGIGLLGVHSINDDIKFNYGLGYFRLVNDDLGNRVGKDLGFEIDLGIQLQLLDNLSFETQFGYMFNGNAYKIIGFDMRPSDTFAWASVLTVAF
ncbi:MAG: hypothetical protein LBV23_11240 [Deltaproteobacteria bacterium]|jgi:hypothetical protein|nr:hypothetical protein [Deltaproteobacteria bacterium]